MRTMRHALRLGIVFVALGVTQLGTAEAASAATTCRDYDGWHHNGQVLSDRRVCIAPASDHPRHTGWARLVRTYSTGPDVCGFSLLPYDIDDPMPMIGCPAMMPPPLTAWRWTGSRWTAANELQEGASVWTAPFGSGWRWVWTQQTGWLAIEQKHVAFRWFA